MLKGITSVLCGLLLLCVYQCSQQVSQAPVDFGGGTETIGISGKAIDTSGLAVAGALAKLRRSDYLDTGATGLLKTAVFLANVEADSEGRFFFGKVDTGAYTIELIGTGYATAVSCTVLSIDSVIELGTVSLLPTATLHGIVARHLQFDSARIRIYIYGLDRVAETNAFGEFEFSGLSSGTYSLYFAASSAYGGYDTAGVMVKAGENHAMGSIGFPQKRLAMNSGDSLAVAAILDSNGLSNVRVGDVAQVDQLTRRVVVLNLSRRGILRLPADIGRLGALRELYADGDSLIELPAEIDSLRALEKMSLRQNRLASLPAAIGGLGALTFLDLSLNELTILPPEIGGCRSLNKLMAAGNHIAVLPESLSECAFLQYLVVDGNEIASLPQSFIQWHPDLLLVSIDFNRFCVLTFDEQVWLDRYSVDRDWRFSQVCN